jgi:hypothetical protein
MPAQYYNAYEAAMDEGLFPLLGIIASELYAHCDAELDAHWSSQCLYWIKITHGESSQVYRQMAENYGLSV